MSGTPTVVWRRTGEICLVGMEFSLLTEWPPQELIRGKFIYEVLSPNYAVLGTNAWLVIRDSVHGGVLGEFCSACV